MEIEEKVGVTVAMTREMHENLEELRRKDVSPRID